MANFLRQLGMVVVVTVFITTVVACFTYQANNTPVVQMSWSSQVCLKVISTDDSLTCDNMPERFVVEWVR